MEIGFDDTITKEQFRRIAMTAIDSCVAVPDDIWQAAQVKVVMRFRNFHEVVVELRDAEELQPEEIELGKRLDTLSVLKHRYEAALRQIAHGDHNFKTLPTDIAREALGD